MYHFQGSLLTMEIIKVCSIVVKSLFKDVATLVVELGTADMTLKH